MASLYEILWGKQPAQQPVRSALARELLSENDIEFGGSPVDRLKETVLGMNAAHYSPEQAAKNRSQTLTDLMYMTPIVGNIMSARDAPGFYSNAAKAAQSGDMDAARKEMIFGHLSTLGAITGLPFGRTAASVARDAKDTARSITPWVGYRHEDIADSLAQDAARRQQGFDRSPFWAQMRQAQEAARNDPAAVALETARRNATKDAFRDQVSEESFAKALSRRVSSNPVDEDSAGPLVTGLARALAGRQFQQPRMVEAIPMDNASRADRALEMGYSDQPFYRGEATGRPYGGGPAFFSRDPKYAEGFAQKGGQNAPMEYKLNLQNTFSDAEPLTAGQYGKLVEAAAASDPKLASDLAETIAPGKGVEWLIGFAKARPDFVVVEKGGAPLVRQAIEKGSRDSSGLFQAAGYDALDSGRDVQKLTGSGIRSKDAAFDPSRASSKDILAVLAGASLLPAWLLSQGSTSRQD